MIPKHFIHVIAEILVIVMWFGYAHSLPDVGNAYIRFIGFDARGVLVLAYLMSLVVRFVAWRTSQKVLQLVGCAFSLAAILISIVVARDAYRYLGGGSVPL